LNQLQLRFKFILYIGGQFLIPMKTIKCYSIFLLLIVSSFVAFGQEGEKKSPLRLLIGGALEFGGDDIAEIYFTNGDTQSVRAGQGGSLAIGGQLEFPKAEKLLLRATVGIKYVTTQADNAHIRLTRIPLIVTANWMITDKLRCGAGLASHQNIKFNADGIMDNISFGSANGPIFEIAYHGIGLSYTAMTYKDSDNVSYSANSIGIIFSGVFPKR
jgi:hypothetical protein